MVKNQTAHVLHIATHEIDEEGMDALRLLWLQAGGFRVYAPEVWQCRGDVDFGRPVGGWKILT